MSNSALLHQVATAALPVLDPRAWRDDLLARSRAGARVLTLHGQRFDERVQITAVLRGAGAPLNRAARKLARSGGRIGR